MIGRKGGLDDVERMQLSEVVMAGYRPRVAKGGDLAWSQLAGLRMEGHVACGP